MIPPKQTPPARQSPSLRLPHSLVVFLLLAASLSGACSDPPPPLPAEGDEPEDTGPVDAGPPADTVAVVDTYDAGSGIQFEAGPTDLGAKQDTKKDTFVPPTDAKDTADTPPPQDVGDSQNPEDSGQTLDSSADPDGSTNGDTTIAAACTADEKTCKDDKVVQCNSAGNAQSVVDDCVAKGGICVDAACKLGVVCDPASKDYCDANQNAHMQCLDAGKNKKLVTQCAQDNVCAQTIDGFDCFPKQCEPNQWLCHGAAGGTNDLLVKCNKFGSAVLSVNLSKGTDCAKAGLSCVVLDGKPQCAAAKCGDGKVNGKDEECDDGAKNGGKDALCTDKCKKIDQSCVSAKDCSDKLGTLECLSHWECAGGQCIGFKSSAVLCDDGDKCTELDHCDVQGKATVCVGVPLSCDDDNPCTTDKCDPAKGCVIENGSKACDDGNKCTLGDKCKGGSCVPGENACSCKSDLECAAYDDGNLCNGVLKCESGACITAPGTTVSCGKGVCINPSVTKKDLCINAKGNFFGGQCHIPKLQNSGDCVAAKGIWVDDEVCRAATCLPHLGFCIAAAKPDLTACEDGSKCSIKDFCKGGACSGNKVDCDDNNLCTDDKCDPTKGCVNIPNDQPCSDGDTCTSNDVCAGGTCTGKQVCECQSAVDCAGKDPTNKCLGTHKCVNNFCYIDGNTITKCSSNGTECAPIDCDPKDGTCKVVDPPGEGTPCTIDGDVCIIDAACKCTDKDCKNRVCSGKKAVCNDGNACTTDACHPTFGCTFKNNTSDCSDNNPCTKGDACTDGNCTPGNEVCTYCEKSAADPDGKKYCSDKIGGNDDKCTASYECISFKCIFKPTFVQCGPGKCSDPTHTTYDGCITAKGTWTDDNECTVTKCDSKTGKCEPTFLAGVFCSDNDECTVNDQCAAGACKTDPRTCNDGDPCTLDSCDKDKTGGCEFNKEKAEGMACDDGNKCTEGSKCGAGFCLGGKKKGCDDGNTCTFDTCSDKTGECEHVSYGAIACTTGDKCVKDAFCDAQTVSCKATSQLNCDKQNLCIDYSCDPKVGCVQLANEVTCTSPDKCFTDGKCTNGSCQVFGDSKTDCNDANVCTNDSCDPTEGCKHKANINAPCSDEDACTTGDKCIQDFDKTGIELGVCTGPLLDCNDENACTSDSCDAKAGCVHKPTKGVCGAFAHCSTDVVPKCVFAGGSHIVISEISLGGNGPKDDFIELHNASTLTTALGDYQVQWRKAESNGIGGWNTLVELPKTASLAPGQYFVIANSGTLTYGRAADLTAGAIALLPNGMQLRLYDVSHTLEHDRVAWGVDSCGSPSTGGEGDALDVWPGVGSWERKASKDSNQQSMRRGGKEWLAGNGYDKGDNATDFYHRSVPDPQPQKWQKQYEPACQQNSGIFTCSGQKPICDFKKSPLPVDWGFDACIADGVCSLGCGAGQECEKSIGVCVPHTSNRIVISEVFVGGSKFNGQFIELHNVGKTSIDIGGFVVETKKKESALGANWDTFVATVPAATVLPPGHFYVIANKDWIDNVAGGVDLLVDKPLGIAADGGAVHVFDPSTNVELDLFGWGSKTKTYSISPFAIPQVPDGQSLVRKATASSHPGTMGSEGNERLAGNGQDTDNDSQDWTLRDKPEPWSLRSAQFKPACNGACQAGMVCNFDPAGAKCIPDCGVCKEGQACNAKTGKCDLSVLISGYANYGPIVKVNNDTLSNQYNWFIELYNPGDSNVNLSGMLLQFRTLAGTFFSMTKPFPDGVCVLLKTGDKKECQGSSPCECRGEAGSTCKNNTDCQPATLSPKKYFLVTPFVHDPAITPDLRSHYGGKMESDVGEIRLVHQSAHKIYGPKGNRLESDLVAWGTPGLKYDKDMLTQLAKVKSCDGKTEVVVGEKCMMRRLPSGWTNIGTAELNDTKHPAYYAGNGRTTNVYSDVDWVRVCPRSPRNSQSISRKP